MYKKKITNLLNCSSKDENPSRPRRSRSVPPQFFSDWFAPLGLGFCFLGVFLFVLSSQNLTSSETPNCPPIPPLSNRNTWYWGYRGVGALGRAATVLYLWWADVTVPDQTGACRRESCSLCLGNRIVAIKGWHLLQGRGSSQGPGDIKGDRPLRVRPVPCPL